MFRGIQSCFLHGGSEPLACFEPTDAMRFLKKCGKWYVLYSMIKESTFLKENFCLCKVFIDVFYILTSAWQKTTECTWNWFFAMCSADLTCLNGSSNPVSVIRQLLFRINLWGLFLNKNFQEIKLFICHCSFITSAHNISFLFMFYWITIYFLIH